LVTGTTGLVCIYLSYGYMGASRVRKQAKVTHE